MRSTMTYSAKAATNDIRRYVISALRASSGALVEGDTPSTCLAH